MSLRESLAAVAAELERKIPAEASAIMARATEELRASGILERVKKVEERAPDLVLPDEEGRMTPLADLLKRGPVALVFQRGAWCPFCSEELKALEGIKPQIEAMGACLVAVSPQTQDNSKKTKENNNLTFTILSDEGNRTADVYGLKFTLHPAVKPIYQALGIDLTYFNGDDSWTLPMPARFVIRPDGVIVAAEAGPDYALRPEPEDILSALERLRI